MKKILLFAVVLMLLFISYPNLLKAQSAGFNTTFIIINNGASDTYYDLQATTGNPDFNGANLGTFCFGASNALIFKGAEHNVYKCGLCDLTSTRVYYSIYPTSTPSGSFVSNNIPWVSGFNNGCDGQDQQWKKTDYSTDLLSGLPAGNYTMEVYSDASTTCFGTVYASNGGNNYKATFTINPTSVGGTISGGTNVCSGTNSTDLTLSGHVGNVIKWQYSTDGGNNWLDIANTGTTYTATDLTVTTQYQAIVKSGECASATSSVSTITVYAGIPTSVSVSASPNPICAGATLTLTGAAINATGWSWTGPNGFSSTQQNPQIANITEAAAGVYSLTASNSCGAAEVVTTSSVTVNSLPTEVSAIANPNPICAGATLTLTGAAINATSWSWTGPNDFVSNDQNPQIANITAADAGVFSLIASNACGAATTVSTAVVIVNPIVTSSVSISASATTITPGTSVEFTATPVNGGSTPYFEWHIGNDQFTVPIATTISSNPENGDVVYVIMTSSLCAVPATATSNTIPITVINAPANSTWDGSEDNDWHNAENWSAGVPGGETDVTIPFTGITKFPTIESGAACQNITLESGASILGNNYLNVTGTATVKRTISGGAWHLVSSPVSGAKASVFLHDYLQSWDETTATWTDIENENTTLNVLQGYSLWETTGGTSAFTGAMNSGPKSISITFTSLTNTAFDGANLLGNPYPSAIDWEQVSGYGAVYYWNGSAYVAYPEGTNGYGTGSQYIPPMQGFFIVVPDNNPNTFTFTNAMRTHVGASNYYKSTNSLTDGLMLSATNGEYEDKLLIRQNEEASEGFDFERDAWKLPSNTSGLSQLWSVCADGNLSIDVHPATEVIQLGFANDQAGTYSIALDEMAGIGNAILEDTRENTFTDLGKGAYSFNWQPADNELRFRLHTGALAVAEKETTHTDIYSYQQTVYVNFNDNINGDIYIYNLAGQLITAKESASGNVRIGLTSTGVYMVKVVTEKETLTQKVVIR